MVEPALLVLWLFLGTLTGWIASRFLFGYGLPDDLAGGAFGAILGGVLANVLFHNIAGGFFGSLVFAVAIAIVLTLALRVIPNNRVMF